VVAIFLPRRIVQYLDLRLLLVLLLERVAYFWLRQQSALLCIQLLGMRGLRLAHWNYRLLDGLRFCAEDIWRYQSGLSKSLRLDSSIDNLGNDGEQDDSWTDGPSATAAKALHAARSDLSIPGSRHELDTVSQIEDWLGSAVYRVNEGPLYLCAEMRLQERATHRSTVHRILSRER
jgi:hypothetical protein